MLHVVFSFPFFSNLRVNVSRWRRLWPRLTSPPRLLLPLRGGLPLRSRPHPLSVGLFLLTVKSSATTASNLAIPLRNAPRAQSPLRHQQPSLLSRSNERFFYSIFTSSIVFLFHLFSVLFINNYLFPLAFFKAWGYIFKILLRVFVRVCARTRKAHTLTATCYMHADPS